MPSCCKPPWSTRQATLSHCDLCIRSGLRAGADKSPDRSSCLVYGASFLRSTWLLIVVLDHRNSPSFESQTKGCTMCLSWDKETTYQCGFVETKTETRPCKWPGKPNHQVLHQGKITDQRPTACGKSICPLCCRERNRWVLWFSKNRQESKCCSRGSWGTEKLSLQNAITLGLDENWSHGLLRLGIKSVLRSTLSCMLQERNEHVRWRRRTGKMPK